MVEVKDLCSRRFELECEIAKLRVKAASAIPGDLSDVSVALLEAFTKQLENLNNAIDTEQPSRQSRAGQGALF